LAEKSDQEDFVSQRITKNANAETKYLASELALIMEDKMRLFKTLAISLIGLGLGLGLGCLAQAVECTLSVTETVTKTTSSKSFRDEGEVTTVTLKNFTATYFIDRDNQIESLSLTLPSGATSSPFYKLGSLPKMGILAKLENGDEASFICIR